MYNRQLWRWKLGKKKRVGEPGRYKHLTQADDAPHLSVDQEQEELALFLAKNIEQERYLDLIGETTYNISILQTAEENKIPDHQVLTHLQLPFSQLFSLLCLPLFYWI